MADVVESKEQVLIRFRDKELRGCTIKKLWLQGISLVGADLSDVTFEDCSLDEVNLTGAQLHRTKFLRTSARSTNMTSATLVRASFSDCNLTELCLEKAHCEGVEFNRCDMDNLRADRSYFGNCTLFPNRAYGIKFRGATLIKLKVSVENGSPELIRAQLSDATVIDCSWPRPTCCAPTSGGPCWSNVTSIEHCSATQWSINAPWCSASRWARSCRLLSSEDRPSTSR